MLELSSANMFNLFISNGIIKYTRKIEGKLYTINTSYESKEDCLTKLQNLSKLNNLLFIEFVTIQTI